MVVLRRTFVLLVTLILSRAQPSPLRATTADEHATSNSPQETLDLLMSRAFDTFTHYAQANNLEAASYMAPGEHAVSRRRAMTETTTTAAPLRIEVHDALTNGTTFTAPQIDQLMAKANECSGILQGLLNVRDPVEGNLSFTRTEAAQINLVFWTMSMNITLPAAYVEGQGNGLPADLLVLLVDPEDVGLDCFNTTGMGSVHLAAALPIWFDQRNGRPNLAIATACPTFLDPAVATLSVDVLTHELVHSLGFTNMIFRRFFSPEQFYQDTNVYGNTCWFLATSNVLRWTRSVFQCPGIAGVPLEDEGSTSTAGSHWEQTLFADDTMVGIAGKAQRITNLTLSLLQDLGWYLPNYELAGPTNWGTGTGCDFFNMTCDRYMEAYPDQNYWCTQLPTDASCSYDGAGAGRCMAVGTTNGCAVVLPTVLCNEFVPAEGIAPGVFPLCLETQVYTTGAAGVGCFSVRCNMDNTYWVNGATCQPGGQLWFPTKVATCPDASMCMYSSCGCSLRHDSAVCTANSSQCICSEVDTAGCT